MKYLYLIIIFSTFLFFISDIQAQDNKIPSDQNPSLNLDQFNEDNSKKEDKLHNNSRYFSSIEVSVKKKKESIDFNHNTMRINLKYIENR